MGISYVIVNPKMVIWSCRRNEILVRLFASLSYFDLKNKAKTKQQQKTTKNFKNSVFSY